MVPKWCPDVKNKVVKRKTATITRYKKSLCLQGFSQITYKKICGNTGRFWLFHDPRNQFDSDVTWVRIPPSAPKTAPCGVLSFIFAANYARVARWDSNSPCPALCVPPGCNSPADCCKGAGESHRLRQVSLLNSTLGSDFLLPLCKIPVLFL